MSTPDTRSALAALDAARPLLVRLDERRHPEDAAADLIEGWASVETALRAMAGGSSLGGQALVSDVRARGLLDYPHAHALLGFLAARDRATRPDYQPTAADVSAARAGFQAIEAANGAGIAADTDVHPTVARPSPYAGAPYAGAPYGNAPLPTPPRPPARDARDQAPLAPSTRSAAAPPPPSAEREELVPTLGRRRSPLLAAGIALLLLLAAGGGYWAWASSRQTGALDEGVAAYQAGRRDEARRAFEAAAAGNPTAALPHVYLARLARDEGDIPGATTRLTTALRLEPRNAVAAREMGMLQLQANQLPLAVRFFTRALENDGTDRVAAGWMGCALTRQGNAALAANFYARAGDGDWTACRQSAPVAPGGAPGTFPGAAPGARQPLAP